MGKLHASNNLESLCQILADKIKDSKGNIFRKEVIITQTAGMNAWLKTELSKRNTVFANFLIMNQDSLFNSLYQQLSGDKIQNRSDLIKYKLFDLLDEKDFITDFKNVAAYYENNDLRRFQFAAKISDLFDQYQLYRNEIIVAWDNNVLSTKNKSEKWQQFLWKKLNVKSRESLKEDLISKLESGKEIIKGTFPTISFFGITIFTPFHMKVFETLSECTETDFYLCLPATERELKNELLTNFADKAGELMDMFPRLAVKKETGNDKKLLGKIQNQILNNLTDLKITKELLTDGSVQINSCFTPAREVECLYNYLLDLFDKDKSLQSRDILVMVSDIDKYAPYIRAVFKNTPVDIPIQISGAASTSEDSIVSALEQILLFEEEDFTAEKVVNLVEQNRIRERFNIRECSYIRSSVNKAGIRFGWKNNIDDESCYVSWCQGLEKILLGHAMLKDEEFNGLYPFKDSESSGIYDLLKMKSFTERLHSVITVKRNGPRTLTGWKTWLFEEVIEKLIFFDSFSKEDRAELSSVYRSLSFIGTFEYDEKVPFSIFLDELKTKLFRETRETSLNTGRVTFSSPVPVRGLPCKVIAFMGLDNGVFPRRDSFMGFDLLGEEYVKGDRSKKETDKVLFLDTIMAARENLYLSFVGQSSKDTSELPPSIAVDTLLDYIESHCTDNDVSKLVRKKLVVEHPLHGFSKKYSEEDTRLYTYLYSPDENKPADKKKNNEPTDKKTEITVHSLLKFFEHPLVWYFNNILNIKYEDIDDALPETELFELDSLKEWCIKNELISIPDDLVENYLLKNKKEGRLPLKNLGRLTIDNAKDEIASLRRAYGNAVNGRDAQNIPIDIISGSVRITGTIDSVYKKDFIDFTTSDNSAKYKAKAFIKTLLLCCDNKISTSRFFTKGGGCSNIPVLIKEEAENELERLLQYYLKGNTSPLIFTIEAGKKSILNNATANDTLEVLIEEASEEKYTKTISYPYMRTLCRDGYFDKFNDDNFKEIREIAWLLKL